MLQDRLAGRTAREVFVKWQPRQQQQQLLQHHHPEQQQRQQTLDFVRRAGCKARCPHRCGACIADCKNMLGSVGCIDCIAQHSCNVCMNCLVKSQQRQQQHPQQQQQQQQQQQHPQQQQRQQALETFLREGTKCARRPTEATAYVALGVGTDMFLLNFLKCSETRIVLVDAMIAFRNRAKLRKASHDKPKRKDGHQAVTTSQSRQAGDAYSFAQGTSKKKVVDLLFTCDSEESDREYASQCAAGAYTAPPLTKEHLRLMERILRADLGFYGGDEWVPRGGGSPFGENAFRAGTPLRGSFATGGAAGKAAAIRSEIRMGNGVRPPTIEMWFTMAGVERWLTYAVGRGERIDLKSLLGGARVSTLADVGTGHGFTCPKILELAMDDRLAQRTIRYWTDGHSGLTSEFMKLPATAVDMGRGPSVQLPLRRPVTNAFPQSDLPVPANPLYVYTHELTFGPANSYQKFQQGRCQPNVHKY